MSTRFAVAATLLVALVLTLLEPALSPVAAAPPDAVGEDISATDAPEDETAAMGNSVRARGKEAPVALRQEQAQDDEPASLPTPEPAREASDPGDGPVAKRDTPAKQDDHASGPSRVWPMPEDGYTLTQDFGCTQQLGNLYFPGEGCPASEPVIHTGLDMAAPEGTPFFAAASGWVTLADYDRPTADANTRIIIQHDGRNEGYVTDYLHWIASYVEEGDYVRAGEPIGEVGSVGFSTGAHLHFSVTDLDSGEFIDPMRWLPKDSIPTDYVKGQSRAKLRLPPGTTAGQPESADPSPPEPPKKEDVPESPPDEQGGNQDRSTRNGNGQKKDRGAKKSEDATATETKRSRNDAAATNATAEPTATNGTVEAGSTRKRDRRRERNANGAADETVDSGTEVAEPAASDDAATTKSKRDRKSGGGSGGGGGKPQDQNGNQGGGGKGTGPGGGGGGSNGNGNGNGNGKDSKQGGGGNGGNGGGSGAGDETSGGGTGETPSGGEGETGGGGDSGGGEDTSGTDDTTGGGNDGNAGGGGGGEPISVPDSNPTSDTAGQSSSDASSGVATDAVDAS
ncbi:MAG: M23 family metallopeptidase, partial [Chloroflexia bacterium]|nr:M23 family metallopeptidase [Chloroflexia bacterium]